MDRVNERVERERPYKPYEYYGAPDAEEVMIAMGSICDCAEEVVDYLNAKGKKVGLLSVRLYRPFSAKHFVAEIPETVKRLAVLDRTKEPGFLMFGLGLDFSFKKLGQVGGSAFTVAATVMAMMVLVG